MTDDQEARVEAIRDLANRKLDAIDRGFITGFRPMAERLAGILGDDEFPTTIGNGFLEGSLMNDVYVLVTEKGLLIANDPMREASAFVQRLPYSDIQEVRVEDPPLMSRWTLTGQRQANFVIRTRGELIRLKNMKKNRAEEIHELVDGRIEW